MDLAKEEKTMGIGHTHFFQHATEITTQDLQAEVWDK